MKPILLSTEMVQAILDGRKTVMRRVIKPQIPDNVIKLCDVDPLGYMSLQSTNQYLDGWENRKSQYAVGDILWVRETFNSDWCDHVIYKADGGSAIEAGYSKEPKWRPSIHMPREAARIFLKVTGVRAERLQDITEEQAEKEGADRCIEVIHPDDGNVIYQDQNGYYYDGFKSIWNSTIKKKDLESYGWDANPGVWVYEFERITEDEAKKTEQRMILKISKKF